MRVTVLAFARAREIAGGSAVLDVPAETTIAQLWEQLLAWRPELKILERTVRIARNGTIVDWTTPLCEGDEIALLPPVSGG